jgi:hypothetical protein
MVEHLVRLGWAPESIIMIDMDAGISGRKTIEERPGMSELMRLIESQKSGAVAAQDVDRFFRDVTQMQTNIFIDACYRNDPLVTLPTNKFGGFCRTLASTTATLCDMGTSCPNFVSNRLRLFSLLPMALFYHKIGQPGRFCPTNCRDKSQTHLPLCLISP